MIVWNLKDSHTNFWMIWKIVKQTSAYNPSSKQCNLCPWEKYFIVCKIHLETLGPRKTRRRFFFLKESKIAYRIRTGLCYAEPRVPFVFYSHIQRINFRNRVQVRIIVNRGEFISFVWSLCNYSNVSRILLAC